MKRTAINTERLKGNINNIIITKGGNINNDNLD